MIGSRRNEGLLLLAALGSGCIYSFNNPVQQKPNGSISGHVQLQNAAGQTTLDGGVEVLFSGGLTLRLDSSGEFSFVALPDGTYSLGIYIPPLAANDFPLLTRLSGVVLPGTDGGAVDAVNLGAVVVQPSGWVTGSVTDALGPATAVVAAFAPGPDGGLGTYEAFSVATDAGSYAFYLPAGDHILAASNSSLSVGMPITLQAKQMLTQDFFLDAGGLLGTGNVQGSLVFGGPDGGVTSLPADIDLSNIQFTATDPFGNMTAGNVFASGATFNPGLGAPFFLSVPAGQPLDIRFILPAQHTDAGTSSFDPLLLPAIPALESQTTYLGQVTWLPVSTFLANAPDAGSSGGTTGGATTGGTTAGNTTGSSTAGSTGATTTGSSTSATTTGGTTGATTTGGTTGALSSWSFVSSLSLPASDAGPPYIYGVLPLPLPDGGHRLVWAGNTNVYYADGQGVFGPPTALIDAGELFPLYNLSGARTDGGSVIAWTSEISGLQAAFVPDQGGLPLPIAISPSVSSSYPLQGTATFPGSQGGLAGTFVIAPDPLLGGLLVLFTSDNNTFSHNTVNLDLGGTVYLNTVIGSACRTLDITSGSGFCFAASGAIGSTANVDAGVVVAGAIDTSGTTPFSVGLQRLLSLPYPIAEATMAQGVITSDAGLPDTVVVTAGVTIPSVWTSFSTLVAPPSVQMVPGGSNFELVLPWAGQPVGFSLAASPTGIATRFVESGTAAAPLLPDVLGGYPAANFGLPNGYVDSITAQPTIAACSADGGTLSIWQLPAIPGLDAGP